MARNQPNGGYCSNNGGGDVKYDQSGFRRPLAALRLCAIPYRLQHAIITSCASFRFVRRSDSDEFRKS